MDWGSYILGAGTVLISLLVGFGMGSVSNGREKHDDTDKTRASYSRDIDKERD